MSRDISLKSGLRTFQSIIKEEIRDFQNTSTDQKSKILQILKNVPSLEPSNEQPSLLSHGNSQSVDPSSNPEPSANVLLPNDPPGVTHLAPEILSHYIDPVSESQDDSAINFVQSDSHRIQLSEKCKTQVLKLRA